MGGPTHHIIDIDIARCALHHKVILDQRGLYRRAGDISTRGCDGEIHGINQPSPRLALGCCGADLGAICNRHMGSTGFDKATIAALGRTGVQRAADLRGACRHAGQQGDGAAVVLDGTRLYVAGIVHHAGQQCVMGAGRQHHQAAIGLYQATVFSQAIQ